jgi:4-hydroxy-tetrahydrodipicolinate synthase
MDKKLSVIVICITPFDQQGRVDEAALRRQFGRLRDAGVSVFVAGSGSSEGYTLSHEESNRIYSIAIEELKGKVPVRADGVEPRTTQEMVDFVRRVEHFNFDAVRIMPLDIGHGARPTDAELEKYHSTVIESTSSPIVITSHQAVGYVLPINLIERLLDRHPSIVGINYGGTDIPYLAELIKRVGERIEVHCAGPYNGLTVLGLGGNGFMGGEGNFSPALVASVISAFKAKDMETVRVSFGKLMALASIINRYGGFTLRGFKPLLNAYGLPGGTLRPPRLPISPADAEEMVKAVAKLEIPGIPPLPKR